MSTARFDHWLTSKGIKKNMILQVQHVEKTNSSSYSTGTSSYLGTGFSATITKRDSRSNILIMCNLSAANNYWALGARFNRNGTLIGVGNNDAISQLQGGFGASHYMGNYINLWYPCSYTFLDTTTPNSTTTALVYELELHAYSGIAYLNRTNANTDNVDYEGRPISTITLMEISA